MLDRIFVRIAKVLAVLVSLGITGAMAHAQDLSLPGHPSDPIVLDVPAQVASVGRAADLLQVFVGALGSCCSSQTPIAGRYVSEQGKVTFAPAFGFDLGQDYVARVQVPGTDARLIKFQLPLDADRINAAVTGIYPSGDALPENALRFYLHFSVPMQPHVAFDFITLRDAAGAADDAAFMRFKQELWNQDRTRLTVLIDPGRIKREVATNRRLGPALREGQEYTLAVKGGWPSADGLSVLSPFAKTYRVTAPLRTQPDTRLWRVNAPCTGTRQPLEITFDRPFDRHLLTNMLQVVDASGDRIAGSIEITNDERSWVFVPRTAWPEQDPRVVASTALEDVAGNNFRDLLDHVAGDGSLGTASTDLRIALNRC